MRYTRDKLRARMSSARLGMMNIVRRVTLVATQGGQWTTEGYELEDGIEGTDDLNEQEATDVFQGLNIYARPATADNAEAIMLHVGAKSEHPVIAALRNEDARRRYVDEFGDLAPRRDGDLQQQWENPAVHPSGW